MTAHNLDDISLERRKDYLSLDKRMMRLELSLENISNNLSKHIDAHTAALESLAERLDRLRPPLGQLINLTLVAVSVVLVIVGMVGHVAVRMPMEDIKQLATENHKALVEHTKDGHPASVLREIELLRREYDARLQLIEPPTRPKIGASKLEPE